MAHETVANKKINSFYKYGGILFDGIDTGGDLWRGCVITGAGETNQWEIDECATSAEEPLGIVIDFLPLSTGLEVDLDTANSQADNIAQYAIIGSGALVYGFHDAAATDAIKMGSPLDAFGGTAGYLDLSTDIVTGFVGRSQEIRTAVTTSNYLYLLVI